MGKIFGAVGSKENQRLLRKDVSRYKKTPPIREEDEKYHQLNFATSGRRSSPGLFSVFCFLVRDHFPFFFYILFILFLFSLIEEKKKKRKKQVAMGPTESPHCPLSRCPTWPWNPLFNSDFCQTF